MIRLCRVHLVALEAPGVCQKVLNEQWATYKPGFYLSKSVMV